MDWLLVIEINLEKFHVQWDPSACCFLILFPVLFYMFCLSLRGFFCRTLLCLWIIHSWLPSFLSNSYLANICHEQTIIYLWIIHGNDVSVFVITRLEWLVRNDMSEHDNEKLSNCTQVKVKEQNMYCGSVFYRNSSVLNMSHRVFLC